MLGGGLANRGAKSLVRSWHLGGLAFPIGRDSTSPSFAWPGGAVELSKQGMAEMLAAAKLMEPLAARVGHLEHVTQVLQLQLARLTERLAWGLSLSQGVG